MSSQASIEDEAIVVSDDVDSVSTPASSSKASDVWAHFVELPDLQKVQCLQCKVLLSYKGSHASGTSSLRRHYLETCPKRKRKAEHGQQGLNFAARMSPAARLRLHDLLLAWIIRDQQSLSVVDHPAFQKFLANLPGGYMSPSRRTLGRKIKLDYEKGKGTIAAVLTTLPGRIAITTDGWTAGNRDAYQAITAHYLEEDWSLRAITLGFVPFPAPHTAPNGADLIWRTLTSFGIEKKMSACVTDNASAAYVSTRILKARMEPSPFFEGRCAAHLINLVVKNGLINSERDIMFSDCRALVTLLHKSRPTEDALKASCKAVGIKYIVPPTIMEVRWNSTFAQLNSLLRLEAGLRHFFENGYAVHGWAEVVWSAIRDTVKILTVFKEVSEHLQGQTYPSISTSAESYLILKTELAALRTAGTLTAWGLEVVDLFHEQLQKYREYLMDSDLVRWATVLDPTMKLSIIEADRDRAPQAVVAGLEVHLARHYNTFTQAPNPHPSPAASIPSASGYLKLRQKLNLPEPVPAQTPSSPSQQLQKYLSVPRLNGVDSPSAVLVWWKNHAEEYPALAQMARDIFAIPASSAPSEMVFSRSGEVITKRRNRLSGETVSHIMCLDSWIGSGLFSATKFKSEDLVADHDDESQMTGQE